MELCLYSPIRLQAAILKEAWIQLLTWHLIYLCKTQEHKFYTCVPSPNRTKCDHTAVTDTLTGNSPFLQHYTMGISLCWTAATLLALAPLLGWGRSVHCLSWYRLHKLHSFVQYTVLEDITFTCCTALCSKLPQKISLSHAAQLCSVYCLRR